MALSDYMPYGAPELLEAAPTRMARSTMMGSLAVALLVFSFGAVLSRSVTRTLEPPDEMPVIDLLDLLPPPLSPPDAPPEVVPAQPRGEPDAHSLVEVKPDEVVRVDDVTKLAPSDGRTGDGPVEGSVITSAGSGTFVARDPQPDEFVYTTEWPALARAVEPRYPDLAREAGVEGTVTVLMLVGLEGRVLRAIIAPKGSVPMLDEAALEAARASVFTPALADGHPVKVWVRQQYRFRLR